MGKFVVFLKGGLSLQSSEAADPDALWAWAQEKAKDAGYEVQSIFVAVRDRGYIQIWYAGEGWLLDRIAGVKKIFPAEDEKAEERERLAAANQPGRIMSLTICGH